MRNRLPGAVLLAGASALIGLAVGVGVPALASGRSTPAAHSTNAKSAFPHMNHVFVIMMENSSYADLMASSNTYTKYIRGLAATYGLATQYYGVTHTSLPNYVALSSGSTWGSNSDDEAQADDGYFNHLSLFDQLTSAKVSWAAFQQSMPSAGYTGNYGDCTNGSTPDPTCSAGGDTSTALYVRKHNPAMQYPDIFGNASVADSHVLPISALSNDLKSGKVPDFSFITPNICDDMHGGPPQCPYPNTNSPTDPAQEQLFKDGNGFVKNWVSAIMSSKAWTGNSAIFITWDESDYSNESPYGPLDDTGCCDSPVVPATPVDPSTGGGGDLAGGTLYAGGNVPMIVVARHGARGTTDTTEMNHYSLLQTIELNWGLPFIGYASDTLQVKSLGPLLK